MAQYYEGNLYSVLPWKRAKQEEIYTNSILNKISRFRKKNVSDETYKNLYKDVYRHQLLENGKVDKKIVEAIKKEVGELEVPNFSELEFDKYSVLPFVKKKQHAENTRILATFEKIENEKSPEKILSMYITELKSSINERRMPDLKLLDMIQSKKNRMVNLANSYVATHMKSDGTTQAGRLSDSVLSSHISVIETLKGIPMSDINFARNVQKREVQIQDRLDLIKFISNHREIEKNNFTNFDIFKETRNNMINSGNLEGEFYNFVAKRYSELRKYKEDKLKEQIESAKQAQNAALVAKHQEEFRKFVAEEKEMEEWAQRISDRNMKIEEGVKTGDLSGV